MPYRRRGSRIIQRFIRRINKHKSAGAAYGAIRRDIELLKTLPPDKVEAMQQCLAGIKAKMDELAASAPGLPSRFKQRIDDRLKSRAHDRIFALYGREQAVRAEPSHGADALARAAHD